MPRGTKAVHAGCLEEAPSPDLAAITWLTPSRGRVAGDGSYRPVRQSVCVGATPWVPLLQHKDLLSTSIGIGPKTSPWKTIGFLTAFRATSYTASAGQCWWLIRPGPGEGARPSPSGMPAVAANSFCPQSDPLACQYIPPRHRHGAHLGSRTGNRPSNHSEVA